LMVEVQEERERLLPAILLALGVAALGLLTGVALAGAIVVLFWVVVAHQEPGDSLHSRQSMTMSTTKAIRSSSSFNDVRLVDNAFGNIGKIAAGRPANGCQLLKPRPVPYRKREGNVRISAPVRFSLI
jgi:hypothetical protein